VLLGWPSLGTERRVAGGAADATLKRAVTRSTDVGPVTLMMTLPGVAAA